MGNEQSTQKRPPKTNAEKKVKNGDLNGHAVPNPDGTELVASKTAAVEQKSEPPPVTIKNEPKPPKKEEVDGCKLNGPAHVATTSEQKTTVVKNAEPPKTVPKPSEDEVTTLFGKMFKKKSEPVKPALESNDSVDALVDLKIDLQPDKVFINSDQKEILEEVAEKLKLQLVDAIPAQPKSPSSLTKNISMESSSANAEDVTCPEVLPDLHTEQEPVSVAEEPLSEEPVTRKASEIHVGLHKSELPLTADAEVPEDEEPKAADAEQALLEDKELLQMVESIISDEREQLACEDVPMCEATKHLTDESISKKLMKTDEESWEIIEEPGRPLNHSGRSEDFQCNSAESTQILSQLKSICTKALEDSSYKPFSVDVCADKGLIHITIEVCPDEFTCLDKDPVDIKTSTQPEPEGETLEPCPVEVTEENHPSEDIKATEKTVMNFFKTFVTPTKTSKEAKATPDASKEQSQKETPPAPPTNAQETPKAPPPPPPAPPKMESKAEPVVKKEETSATKAAAAASAKAEGSAKTKTKDSSFSKLFRPKVDASKSSTLEASAKPEEPPAPKPEEKKQEKKSTFGNMFKPKAPEAKKETPAPPPVAEAAPVVKAKEEPKPAVPAPQTAPDNKSIGSTDNSSPNMPRKLEKRNSLQLFFKNLVK